MEFRIGIMLGIELGIFGLSSNRSSLTIYYPFPMVELTILLDDGCIRCTNKFRSVQHCMQLNGSATEYFLLSNLHPNIQPSYFDKFRRLQVGLINWRVDKVSIK